MKVNIELKEYGVTAVEYFPYSTKSIRNTPRIGREIFRHLEIALEEKGLMVDNKSVVVFQGGFGTDDFALFFKDMYVSVGKWNDIEDY